MNRKFIVAILLAAALPAFAQTQNPSAAKVTKADAQKVFKIISGNKTKSQTYCNIVKLLSQITEGSEQNTDELYQKIEELVPKLGREYVALMDALQDVEPEFSAWSGDRVSISGPQQAVYQVGLDVDQGQKIRRRRLQLARLMERSEGLAALNYLLSGDATTRSLSRSNSRRLQHQKQRRMTHYLAPFSSLTMGLAPCHCALNSAIACSREAE